MTLAHPRGNVPICAKRETSEPACTCCWIGLHATIGEAVQFLKPCAGHSVYGDWRVSEARKALVAARDALCEAAVAWDADVRPHDAWQQQVMQAAIDYARAVRK